LRELPILEVEVEVLGIQAHQTAARGVLVEKV
jgi:hypothetical protein